MLLSAFFYWLIICRCFSLLLYDLVFFFYMLVLWWWVSIFSDVVGKVVSVAGEWAWNIGSVYCLKWYCLWVASWQIVLVSEFLVLAGCSIGGFWDCLMFFFGYCYVIGSERILPFFYPCHVLLKRCSFLLKKWVWKWFCIAAWQVVIASEF